MSSQVIYTMHGFNRLLRESDCKRKVTLINNFEYHFENHGIIESVFIDEQFKQMKFTLLPGLEAMDYMKEIEDELEKICFNIIAYSEVPTSQPFCCIEMITNAEGTQIDIRENLKLTDSIEICTEVDASDFYKLVMDKNTPLSNNKAKYKELFYILHSPHRVIQFIALYDTLENMICSHGERLKQKRVHDFFGKYKERYSYIRFHKCNDNPKKSEDTFTHLRNNIAHSKDAGIEEFIKTSNAISNNEIVQILQVINDIISGEVKVD